MAEQTFELYLHSNPEIRASCLAELAAKYGSTPQKAYPDTRSNLDNLYTLTVDWEGNVWDTARDMEQVNGIVEVDPIVELLGSANRSIGAASRSLHTTWNHGITNFDQAVELSVNQGRLDPQLDTDITIVQLDTGYTGHPEIARIIKKGKNFVQDEPADDAKDCLDDGFLEQPSHGTATASVIIGASTPLANDTNNGVFPYVKLVPYRISPSVIHITRNTIAAAVVDAVDSGCDIITMSMGGAPPRRSWKEAAKYALSKGVIFVSAAGNQVAFVVWPARYSQVIAVAAVNVSGLAWSGSCRGPQVTISAPGEDVFVAQTIDSDSFTYHYSSGTSFATPHVAAAAALWLNHFQDELADPHFVDTPSERVQAFRYALTQSAHIPDDWTSHMKRNFGAGILDAKKLIAVSPTDYRNATLQPMFGISTVLELAREEKSPTLLEKEMLYLLLNNEPTTTADLEAFVQENGSATARSAFQDMQAASASERTLLESAFSPDASYENANALRAVYLESLASSW